MTSLEARVGGTVFVVFTDLHTVQTSSVLNELKILNQVTH
jgi:hypothetical protein